MVFREYYNKLYENILRLDRNRDKVITDVRLDDGIDAKDDSLRYHHIFYNGNKVGFVEIWYGDIDDGCEISNVKIDEEYRGKGIYGKVLQLLANRYGYVESRNDDTVSPEAKRAWKKVLGDR